MRMRSIAPPAIIRTCRWCEVTISVGHDDSHSNRCPLFGGHSLEQCSVCRTWYRPAKGWRGSRCAACVSTVQRTVSSPRPARRSAWYQE